jgi:hypothetical protein
MIIVKKLLFVRRDVNAIVMLTNVITHQVQCHTVDIILILSTRTDTMRFIWIKKQYITWAKRNGNTKSWKGKLTQVFIIIKI